MIYLLDANVLINANNFYYSFNAVPQFWEWLIFMGASGNVKIPIEIYEEIKDGSDDLSKWIKNREVKSALLLNEECTQADVAQVIDIGYANNLTDIEIERLGMDPLLISYALNHNNDRRIVTAEFSQPKKKRANRKVPDVCSALNILWCNEFQFTKFLKFSTNWNKN